MCDSRTSRRSKLRYTSILHTYIFHINVLSSVIIILQVHLDFIGCSRARIMAFFIIGRVYKYVHGVFRFMYSFLI